MNAAGYILAINLFVAGIFATAFGVVAAYSRTAISARWLAFAYVLGILNAVLEFILPLQADTRPMEVLVFSVALLAFIVAVIGLARHYTLPVPWWLLSAFGLISVIVVTLTLSLPYESLVRTGLYQLPYAIVHVIGAWIVFRCGRKSHLEIALLVFFLISGLQFIAKPLISAALGSGANPHVYLQSLYGTYSQMMTAFLLITNGLLMLLIIVRDVMAEITARSETDKLSGLLNRRGFEERADKAITAAARTSAECTMIVADLDHFKQINDNFGHAAGDQVIATFAHTLAAMAEERTVVLGRLGGEEFAVFLPGSPIEAGQAFAEGVRKSFSSVTIAGLGPGHRVTASFGVAPYQKGDSLSDLLRRTDAALYEAKKAGRNRIQLVTIDGEMVAPAKKAAPHDRRRGSRSLE